MLMVLIHTCSTFSSAHCASQLKSQGETGHHHLKAPLGTHYPSMYDLTPTVQPTKTRPQHQKLARLCDKCVGSLISLADHNNEDAGDRAYGLLSLSKKTTTSNHLHMSLER